MAEALAAEHRVTVLAPAHEAAVPTAPAELPFDPVPYRPPSSAVRLLGLGRALAAGRPLQSGLFGGADLLARLDRLAPEADLVLVQLARLAPVVEHLARRWPRLPRVVDLVDSLALSTARRARFDHPWLAPLLRLEARRLERWERRLVGRSRATWVVCERDRDAVAASLAAAGAGERGARLAVVPVAIPGGDGPETDGSAIDGPVKDAPATDGGAPRSPRLVVTGNLGYFPTHEGLLWFLDRVWPSLVARRPGLVLTLAGSRPRRSLARRVDRAPGAVELVATPPSLAPFLAAADLALAPMRCGAGQPLKILEAWAAGVPVVATPWAAAGCAGRDGVELTVADGADAWGEAVDALLEAPQRVARQVAAARRRLEGTYAPERVARAVRAAIRSIADET